MLIIKWTFDLWFGEHYNYFVSVDVHMGLTPPPLHMRPLEPDPPPRVDVINGWPLKRF